MTRETEWRVGSSLSCKKIIKYDTDAILADLKAKDIAAIIPPKRNRKVQPIIDGHHYALRNLVESAFQNSSTAEDWPLVMTKQPTVTSASSSSHQSDFG